MQLSGNPFAYGQKSCYSSGHVICTRRFQVSYSNLTIKHTSSYEGSKFEASYSVGLEQAKRVSQQSQANPNSPQTNHNLT